MQIPESLLSLSRSVPLALQSLGPAEIVDILAVALLAYFVLIFIKRTRSYFVINFILALVILSFLSQAFNFELIRALLQPLYTFIVLIVVVVYQREIRNFFDWFSLANRNLSFLKKISVSEEISLILVNALTAMAGERTGAIIVLEGEYPLEKIMEGGFPLEGKVSVPLLLSIFDHHTPGHDGAVYIKNHLISGFGLHLPLAVQYSKYAEHGTRHRAAAGITEHTDAMALVVSEERGTISVSEKGVLHSVKDKDDLEEIIRRFLKENVIEQKKPVWKEILFENFLIKVASVVLAAVLWFIFVYQTGYITRNFMVPVEFHLPQGEAVVSVEPSAVEIDLVGRVSDFNSFDQKKLHVTVDVPVGAPAKETVKITKDAVSYPNYFSIADIKPSSVTLTEKAAPVSGI